MVEEKNLEPIKEKEEKQEEIKKEKKPEGYYLSEVPTGKALVIANNGKMVDGNQLLIKMANALRDNGLMKD